MGFKEQQAAIEKELDRFSDLLGVLMPRYSRLLNNPKLSDDQLVELGEIEHFLIGITARVTEIKQLLEQDVFGHSLDFYYKLKQLAATGDVDARKKMEKLRSTFNETLKSGDIIQWN